MPVVIMLFVAIFAVYELFQASINHKAAIDLQDQVDVTQKDKLNNIVSRIHVLEKTDENQVFAEQANHDKIKEVDDSLTKMINSVARTNKMSLNHFINRMDQEEMEKADHRDKEAKTIQQLQQHAEAMRLQILKICLTRKCTK